MHLDFALPVDGDLEAGIKRHDKKSELAVMDYSYHVPITEWSEKVRWILPCFYYWPQAACSLPSILLSLESNLIVHASQSMYS